MVSASAAGVMCYHCIGGSEMTTYSKIPKKYPRPQQKPHRTALWARSY